MDLNITIKLPEGLGVKPIVTVDEAGCVNGVAEDGPEQRFVAVPANSEVILDRETGLMWDAVGSDKGMTHADAEKYVKELKLGGFKDWRLPTVQELLTLVDYGRRNPAIDPAFKCKSECYWTSTPVTGYPDDAWFVGFSGGDSFWDDRSFHGCVRAVRPSQ